MKAANVTADHSRDSGAGPVPDLVLTGLGLGLLGIAAAAAVMYARLRGA